MTKIDTFTGNLTYSSCGKNGEMHSFVVLR